MRSSLLMVFLLHIVLHIRKAIFIFVSFGSPGDLKVSSVVFTLLFKQLGWTLARLKRTHLYITII